MDREDQALVPMDDTMLYREPTDDSDEQAIQDIWGQKLETRVVSAADVPGLLEAGWVTSPMEIGKKPEERAGFERVPGADAKALQETRLALDTAEKLVDELTAKVTELEADLKAASDAGQKLANDLKAADELASAESKAKDEALAEVSALKAQAADVSRKDTKPSAKG